MAETDELDAETLSRMKSYFGRDPRIPVGVTVCVFDESSGSDWRLNEFLAQIASAVNEIPDQYRATAEVTLRADYDESTRLTISYTRPQTNDEIAADIARGLSYVRQSQASEREIYERLKAKFG